MVRYKLVSLGVLSPSCISLGAFQLDMTVVGVSTELSPRGWMEQVRERGEPDTNSDCVGGETVTSGLGTGGEIYTSTIHYTPKQPTSTISATDSLSTVRMELL